MTDDPPDTLFYPFGLRFSLDGHPPVQASCLLDALFRPVQRVPPLPA